jgi:hypothetical protein
MVGPSTYFQDYVADYIVQERKKKDVVVYLGDNPAIGDAESSDISVLFPLLLL